ncbi:hypothetical protein [Actinoplanes sp. NPDC051411]|uniref:hypothetical protein n=1 Tax=Actinoplanes sp. NPDC051411 TaxID=3155522 RepID=UPI00343B34C5
MRAIVFDFFGTLTDPRAEVGRRASFEATAAALGVAPEQFWAAMGASYLKRIVGHYGGTRSTLAAIARQCGGHADRRPAGRRCGGSGGRRRAGAAAAARRAGAA